MKRTGLFVAILVVSFLFAVAWATLAQALTPEAILLASSPLTLQPTPASAACCTGQQEASPRTPQTVLLWPKGLAKFVQEYPSWEMWLGTKTPSSYTLRDELLVSVRAIAALIPDLEAEVETDGSASDAIAVSANSAVLGALLERLRDHPLLEQVTEDSPAQRDKARERWSESSPHSQPDRVWLSAIPAVNVRNSWVNNVVWGRVTPGATVQVTLTRSTSHVLTTTTTAAADSKGLYHAYLTWEVCDGDMVEVRDGSGLNVVPVLPLAISCYCTLWFGKKEADGV